MFSKIIGVAAVFAIGLMGSGCSTWYMDSGIQAFNQGDFHKAHDIFAARNQSNPNDPYAQFNLGNTYDRLGQKDEAVRYYRRAAFSGRSSHPDYNNEPHDAGSTVADGACRNLKILNVSDPSCPI